MPPSFEGNEGNEGNAANVGGGGGTRAIFADRIDLPFVTAEYAPGMEIAQQRIQIPLYPVRNWAPNWYSWLVLTQFVATGWNKFNLLPSWAEKGWNSPKAERHVNGELNKLVVAARNERADALAEIASQSDEFISYFLNLLTAPVGYPATAKLLTIASFIAGYCAMYYKGKYQRPRPTMLCPALLPPLPVPGHASFPSGHSTQGHFIALCMDDVLTGHPQLPSMANDMKALADRIARNREIAGFHYPSDTDAGVLLAQNILPLLKEPLPPFENGDPNPQTTWYQQALEAARAEWVG